MFRAHSVGRRASLARRGSGFFAVILLTASAAVGQTTFQRVLWDGADQKATSVERTSDGGYIVVGNRQVVGVGSRIVLNKLDTYGTLQWGWVYGSSGSDTAQRVRPTSDGGYIIAGETTALGPTLGILVLKTDSLGVLQWSRAYVGTANAAGPDGSVIRELSGGGYVLIGRFVNGTEMQGAVMHLDASGNLICGRLYTDGRFGPASFMSFNDVRQNADGGVTIVGFTGSAPNPPFELLALRTAPGDPCTPVVWARTYGPGPAAGYTRRGEGLELTASSDYVFTGPYTDAAGTSGTFIVRTTAAGAPLWHRLFPTFAAPRSIRETFAGALVVCGQHTDGGILKTNGGGAFAFAEVYGGPNTDTMEEAIPTPDGGFGVVGATNSFTAPFGFYVVKTNPLGLSGCNETPVQLSQITNDLFTDVPLAVAPFGDFVQIAITPTPQLTENTVLCELPGCVPPPGNMSLWLPFDSANPGANLAGGNNGTLVNSPTPNAGYVGTSLCFNGTNTYVNVPSYFGINPVGDFSIDAWIQRATGDSGVRVIVDKRLELPTGFVRGYSFYLYNGQLSCQLANGIGTQFTNYNSLATVPLDGNWHHVAVTVHRNSTTGGVFYIDGVPAGSPFDTTLRNGLLSTGAPFRVASRSSSVSAVFLGCIDEVEFFRRVLSPGEVGGLYAAREDGKCRMFCRLPAYSPFCAHDTSIVVTAYICNYTTIPQTFNYFFQGLPVGPGCTIAGPTSFTPASGSVFVPPMSCAPVTVTIGRPAGMTAVGLVGCYQFTWQIPGTNIIGSCTGSVIDRRDWCVHFPNGLFQGNIGTRVSLGPLHFENDTGADATLNFQVEAVPLDNSPAPGVVSLNGLPPGQPYIDRVVVPAGGSADVQLDARFTDADPLATYSLQVFGDTTGSGHMTDPLTSAFFENEQPPEMAGDLNCDGVVNFADIDPFVLALSDRAGYEAAYPNCNWFNADCNADGQVDFQDIDPFVALLTGG